MRRVVLLALLLCIVPGFTQASRSSFIAVGDLMLQFGPPPTPMYPFDHVARVLRSADVTIGNLECAISDRGYPTPYKAPGSIAAGREFVFRAHPGVVQGLKGAGFDVLSLANNHSMDYTEAAFIDTMRLLRKAGIAIGGGGHTMREARRPAMVRSPAGTAAVLCYSDVIPANYEAGPDRPGIADAPLEAVLWSSEGKVRRRLPIDTDIERARAKADFVVVYFHWGVEVSQSPTQYQRALARRCIDSGADVVLGAHPHVLQGIELYRGKLIAYSLGNFAFLGAAGLTADSGILGWDMTSTGDISAVWFMPATLHGATVRLAGEHDAQRIGDRMRTLSEPFKTRFEWRRKQGRPVLWMVL